MRSAREILWGPTNQSAPAAPAVYRDLKPDNSQVLHESDRFAGETWVSFGPAPAPAPAPLAVEVDIVITGKSWPQIEHEVIAVALELLGGDLEQAAQSLHIEVERLEEALAAHSPCPEPEPLPLAPPPNAGPFLVPTWPEVRRALEGAGAAVREILLAAGDPQIPPWDLPAVTSVLTRQGWPVPQVPPAHDNQGAAL